MLIRVEYDPEYLPQSIGVERIDTDSQLIELVLHLKGVVTDMIGKNVEFSVHPLVEQNAVHYLFKNGQRSEDGREVSDNEQVDTGSKFIEAMPRYFEDATVVTPKVSIHNQINIQFKTNSMIQDASYVTRFIKTILQPASIDWASEIIDEQHILSFDLTMKSGNEAGDVKLLLDGSSFVSVVDGVGQVFKTSVEEYGSRSRGEMLIVV